MNETSHDCPPCADGEHGTIEDGRCTCCGEPRWNAEEAATGHPYRGPGYCRTCGCAEFLHASAWVNNAGTSSQLDGR